MNNGLLRNKTKRLRNPITPYVRYSGVPDPGIGEVSEATIATVLSEENPLIGGVCLDQALRRTMAICTSVADH